MDKISEAKSKRKIWLDGLRSKVGDRNFSLLDRASQVLTDNLIEGTDKSWGTLCGIPARTRVAQLFIFCR